MLIDCMDVITYRYTEIYYFNCFSAKPSVANRMESNRISIELNKTQSIEFDQFHRNFVVRLHSIKYDYQRFDCLHWESRIADVTQLCQ